LIVATKFFPADDENSDGKYPLCETDYFRRLDLLCHACGGALRGSYIPALDRKYHIEHFHCKECDVVFRVADSYYEHKEDVFCLYHYTLLAQKCKGCNTAILKQFYEIFRNSENQHWHPECYMIHKHWNVTLGLTQSSSAYITMISELKSNPTTDERTALEAAHDMMEAKVYRIWTVLSAFEEGSAAYISDMLLHVTNQQRLDFVLAAEKLIYKIGVLFRAIDAVSVLLLRNNEKGTLDHFSSPFCDPKLATDAR